eukprot:2820584-Rhodomonas_salina.1
MIIGSLPAQSKVSSCRSVAPSNTRIVASSEPIASSELCASTVIDSTVEDDGTALIDRFAGLPTHIPVPCCQLLMRPLAHAETSWPWRGRYAMQAVLSSWWKLRSGSSYLVPSNTESTSVAVPSLVCRSSTNAENSFLCPTQRQ